MTELSEPGQPELLLDGFASILLSEVAAAMQRYDSDQSQQSRRDLIRTLFAAIEGYTWVYRTHIIDVARSLDDLPLEEEIALSEVGYQVTEHGKVVSQPRYLSMLAAFRLTTSIATRLNPDLAVRFDTEDWNRLRTAIGIRNRVTHPKSRTDLDISDGDLASAQAAFYWLMETVLEAMKAANTAMRRQTEEFSALLDELREGNPSVWAAYIAATTEGET